MISRISKNIKYNIFLSFDIEGPRRLLLRVFPNVYFPNILVLGHDSCQPVSSSLSLFRTSRIGENTGENARAPENKRGKKAEGRDVEEEGNNVGDNARTGPEQMWLSISGRRPVFVSTKTTPFPPFRLSISPVSLSSNCDTVKFSRRYERQRGTRRGREEKVEIREDASLWTYVGGKRCWLVSGSNYRVVR